MGAANSSTSRSPRPTGRPTRYTATPRRVYRIERTVATELRSNPWVEIPTYARPPDPSDDRTIQVQKVDLHIPENTKAHRTSEFDVTDTSVNKNTRLVVRRGQSFDVTVEFSRPYDANKDDLRFVFQFGQNPKPTRGTHVEFILSDKDEAQSWGGYIVSNEGNCLRVTLVTPPSCYVGTWGLKIDVVKKADTRTEVYRWSQDTPIYVLFNPWCKDDLTYMADDSLLYEYVLSETGKIYAGNVRKISPKPWVFGQFTGNVLDCCMYLLDNCGLPDQQRGNPVLIARKISGFVNSPDDNGVLVGNWSGDYAGGVSPLHWTGSVDILEKYYKNKTPVKYGQCWVFSGVVTTVCRAIGLPCRSVTNFASAHDTDGSITIDIHYDNSGKPLEYLDNDSVWNFHVWNDVWMARPDLPAGYGGWQAIDATPQETSENVYCMGPVSLTAIKRGEVHLPYDGPFAFAEVNADKLYWMLEDNYTIRLAHVQQYGVGRSISTRRPTGRASWGDLIHGTEADREDITDQYKYKEQSCEERAAVTMANLYSSRPSVYRTGAQDVTFDLVADDDTFMGDTIEVTLKMRNDGAESRHVNGTISVSSMYYTGVPYKEIGNKKLTSVKIDPGEEVSETIKLEASQYLDMLQDHCMCKVSCMCIVKETNQTYADVDNIRLRKPHLTIKAPKTGEVGKEFDVEVSFENPLPMYLTGAELRVEGPGIQRPTLINLKSYLVRPKQTFTKTFSMTPAKPGEREIIVYYNCDQIAAVTSSHVINISQ